MAGDKIECNACPVLCQIGPGRTGACDRYANQDGTLIRVDPVLFLRRALEAGGERLVPFVPAAAAPDEPGAEAVADWDGDLLLADEVFVTGVGSSTTYPDYKPAPFIVASRAQGVDMVTVVTEGIFSYCSLKLKIDTDRWLGPEQANVRCKGEVVGHVTTAEYGSQMLSLGGVHHLTGGSKKEGRITLEVMERLGNKHAVELAIDGGAQVLLQAGRAPVVNGVEEQRMRVGCGSAAVGIFAKQFYGLADEVVVVDDHITGVLTEHQAGRCLDMRASGIRMRGRKSTPGRWFQVANPGTGWGGTDISDPLQIVEGWDPEVSWPGLRLLMTSTTGEQAAWYVLDDTLVPREQPMPAAVRAVVDRIGENCEPSLTTVLFLGGAGGSLRAGVTENPVLLTRSIKQALVNVTCGGAPAYVWPGGGITVMADVMRMPDNAFGTVPTPAIVAPIEFSMRLDDYRALGGHMAHVRSLQQALATRRGPRRRRAHRPPLDLRAGGQSLAARPTPFAGLMIVAAMMARVPVAARSMMNTAARAPLPDGRWHFQHGPIDIVIGADGRADAVEAAHEAAWRRFSGLLFELVRELPMLRAPVRDACYLHGPVAQRMWQACRPYNDRFITPMAAVAGSVAQELIAAYQRPGIERAWVNNGGDIALHLTSRRAVSVGLYADLSRLDARQLMEGLSLDGRFEITQAMPVRGIATSGWRGRSFSLGIADSVTVLAATAAQADAAATVIANAVDADDPRIERRPACELKDDCDLRDLPVTVEVPVLDPATVQLALRRGLAQARCLQAQGLAHAAVLTCQGQVTVATPLPGRPLDTAVAARVAASFA